MHEDKFNDRRNKLAMQYRTMSVPTGGRYLAGGGGGGGGGSVAGKSRVPDCMACPS